MSDDKVLSFVLDPMHYIGRVTRGDDGKVRNIEVFYDEDTVTIEQGDEFVTFVTRILLEEPREAAK